MIDDKIIKDIRIIQSGNMGKKLLEIAEYIKYTETLAKDRLDILNTYDKDVEILKIKAELNSLIAKSVAVLSDAEVMDKKAFFNKHYNSCKCTSDFIVSGGVGFGSLYKCYCPVCNETLDITDTSKW